MFKKRVCGVSQKDIGLSNSVAFVPAWSIDLQSLCSNCV